MAACSGCGGGVGAAAAAASSLKAARSALAPPRPPPAPTARQERPPASWDTGGKVEDSTRDKRVGVMAPVLTVSRNAGPGRLDRASGKTPPKKGAAAERGDIGPSRVVPTETCRRCFPHTGKSADVPDPGAEEGKRGGVAPSGQRVEVGRAGPPRCGHRGGGGEPPVPTACGCGATPHSSAPANIILAATAGVTRPRHKSQSIRKI